MLDMESAAKQAVKEMTEDDKALLALFEEYCRTRRSAHGATGMIDFHSGPSEDQMAGEGDQEALEYLQAFAGICRHLRVSRKSKRDWEVRMKNMRTRLAVTPKARRTTGKLKVMIIVSSRKKTPELLSLRLFRYVRVQKRRLISFHCSLLYE